MPEPKLAARPSRSRARTAPEADEAQDFAFLGREFVTWLLFRSARGPAVFEDDAGEFAIAFGARVRLAGPAGDVTDAVLKGRSPGASVEVAAGLGAGRSVREAELRISRSGPGNGREFRFTLVSETLDLKSVKLPARLKDAGDDRLGERMALLEELESCIRAAFQAFVRERTRPVWARSVIPDMRSWLAESLEVE